MGRWEEQSVLATDPVRAWSTPGPLERGLGPAGEPRASREKQAERSLRRPGGVDWATLHDGPWDLIQKGDQVTAPRDQWHGGRVSREGATPRRATPHRATPHRAGPHWATPGHATPGHATLRQATPHWATPGHATQGCTTQGHATPGHTGPHGATPHKATPRRAGPRQATQGHTGKHRGGSGGTRRRGGGGGASLGLAPWSSSRGLSRAARVLAPVTWAGAVSLCVGWCGSCGLWVGGSAHEGPVHRWLACSF